MMPTIVLELIILVVAGAGCMRQAMVRAWCRPPTGQAALPCPVVSTVVVTTNDLILGMMAE